MDSGTTFKFRGYSGKRSGAAVSSLFLDYDDDDDDDDRIYDMDVTGRRAGGAHGHGHGGDDGLAPGANAAASAPPPRPPPPPPPLYANPAELCRVQDAEEVASSVDDAHPSGAGAGAGAGAGGADATAGAAGGEGSMCFDVPDAALSSCVWVGSSLLSRMLFQIYNEMGDESKTNTW
jgi:hypothetical protein